MNRQLGPRGRTPPAESLYPNPVPSGSKFRPVAAVRGPLSKPDCRSARAALPDPSAFRRAGTSARRAREPQGRHSLTATGDAAAPHHRVGNGPSRLGAPPRIFPARPRQSGPSPAYLSSSTGVPRLHGATRKNRGRV